MRELSDKNFGIVIAYLIPGFMVLWGVSYLSPVVKGWLEPGGINATPSLGSFLYVLLSSLAAGLIVSAIRWATIDTLHHATGLRVPPLNFAALPDKLDAFVVIVEANYRFYQFYANACVALLAATVCRYIALDSLGGRLTWLTGVCLEAILLAGSRDSLRRYYERASALLGTE
jgi:hypothetical protein